MDRLDSAAWCRLQCPCSIVHGSQSHRAHERRVPIDKRRARPTSGKGSSTDPRSYRRATLQDPAQWDLVASVRLAAHLEATPFATELGEVFRRKSLAHDKALNLITTQLPQPAHLPDAIDALGYHLHCEVICDRNDR